MGKCIMCDKETRRVQYSRAIVKIYICSQKCLKEYYKPLKGYKPKIPEKTDRRRGMVRLNACIHLS